MHKKIIDKGIPEFATLGWINEDCALPPEPLTGMVNKYGNKVRLTFKFETDEVWIGTPSVSFISFVYKIGCNSNIYLTAHTETTDD